MNSHVNQHVKRKLWWDMKPTQPTVSSNKFKPHQGKSECARRRRQMHLGVDPQLGLVHEKA